jgi:hypothetical protein
MLTRVYQRLRTWVMTRSPMAPQHRALVVRIIVFAVWAYFFGYVQGRLTGAAKCEIPTTVVQPSNETSP